VPKRLGVALAVGILGTSGLLAACTQPPNVPAVRAQGEVVSRASAPVAAVVTVGYPAFGPSVVTIRAGQAVKWVWRNYYQPDQIVFSDGVKSPIMNQGSFVREFDRPGVYPYRSPFHYQARGVVRVLP
jgi:plastocyanin